jgi:ankyrin repeat protein
MVEIVFGSIFGLCGIMGTSFGIDYYISNRNGRSDFLTLCEKGDLEGIKQLVTKEKEDINNKNHPFWIGSYYITVNDHEKNWKYIELGYKIAFAKQYLDIMKYLDNLLPTIKFGKMIARKYNQTGKIWAYNVYYLYNACDQGNMSIIEYIVNLNNEYMNIFDRKTGLTVAQTILQYAINRGNLPVIKYLLTLPELEQQKILYKHLCID